MTATQPDSAAAELLRYERIYLRLLRAYPKDFREEYRSDLLQALRDLLSYSSDQRAAWRRVVSDLFTSAAKQRAATLAPRRRPSTGLLVVIGFLVVAGLIMGPGPMIPLVLLPTVVMFALPAYGFARFRRAWIARRSLGGPIAGHIIIGVAAFVPAIIALVALGPDAGYLIFVSVGLGLILSAALGVIWAVATLAASRRSDGRSSWRRPAVILIPCLAVLAVIIGASYNSYRQSLGPAGDHSVANASAETRALWDAANSGRVDEVINLTTTTCADPWVKFPYGNGRHNAKGQAETRELELPDHLEAPYREISDILDDYMDVWSDACVAPAS